jgi:sugar transferase (PEP-CTERM/EpsH1 system associated)
MRILYLAHRVPFPPNKGDKIRSFNEIRHLSRNHDIHLLAFCDRAEETAHKDALKEYCRTVDLVPLHSNRQKFQAFRSMLVRDPWTLGYYSSTEMSSALRRAIDRYRLDLILVFSSSMAPYVCSIRGIPRVLDFVDSDASKWRQYGMAKRWPERMLYAYEARRLAAFELKMVRLFDLSVFVSDRETGDIPRPLRQKIAYVQNGIDLEFFRPAKGNREWPAIVFTGAMDYFPNADAVRYFSREVLPRVQQRVPGARFTIVGSNPARSVRRLTALPGISVTGSVPDIRPYLNASRLAVTPIRIAQGIQNKILEALAMGLPVVATTVAGAGLGRDNLLPISLADDAGGFAEIVIERLQNPSLSPARIESCREYLKRHYDWHTNLSRLDSLLIELRQGMQKHDETGNASPPHSL